MKYCVVPLGGCPLNIPLDLLRGRRILKSVFQEVGFRRWPLALSSADALQLLNFALGRKQIPAELHPIAYLDPENWPKPDTAHLFKHAELILVEMSTPIILSIDGIILNHNHFNNYLKKASAEDPVEIQRSLMFWRYEGLQMQNETRRVDLSAQILDYYEKKEPRNEFLLRLVRDTRGKALTAADMVRDLNEVRDALNLPMVIILHHYNYMPGARPVSFPPSFLRDSKAAVQELNVPFFDPAPLVKKHGTDVAMAEDMRHYKKEFYNVVADEYLAFINEVTGKPDVAA